MGHCTGAAHASLRLGITESVMVFVTGPVGRECFEANLYAECPV